MTPPLLLIADREFRAYVATLSFWVALAVGPLCVAGALGWAIIAARPAPPTLVSIEAPSPALERSAAAALAEAARLEGRPVRIVSADDDGATVVITRSSREGEVRFVGPAPLSPEGRALVARTLERDEAASSLAATPAPDFRVSAPPEPVAGGAIARFALVLMLWLTLTGSLGMLLQAIVRERANRTLEGLLAAARPFDLIIGKLIGVGAVSALVIGVWLGATAALAPLAPKGTAGLGPAALAALGDAGDLIRAAVIYLLAYGFYGLLTLGLGARARDVAHAQNLSRPMFALLLAAFFAALASAAGAGRALAWLVYLPPFTPFMLLLAPAPLHAQAIAIALLVAATLLCGRFAISILTAGRDTRVRRRTADSLADANPA